MKQIRSLLYIITLLAFAACNGENDLITGSSASNKEEVTFNASLAESQTVQTRTIGDGENGAEVPMKLTYAIHIQKIQNSETTENASYQIKSGNYGVLELPQNNNAQTNPPIKWMTSDFDTPADFYAWTEPTGVTTTNMAGTVDFVEGNKFKKDGSEISPVELKDKYNDKHVTPLEIFVSALAENQTRISSPSVSLPFKHLVSKVSLYLRDWRGGQIKENVTITFLSIPQKWNVGMTTADTKSSFQITAKNADLDNNNLTLDLATLQVNANYHILYLPPMTTAFESGFEKHGDFYITYNNKQYYGSLSALSIKELQAGQHIALHLDLSENYGVGVGAWIEDWNGPREDEAWANPRQGIYSLEGWKEMVNNIDAIKSGTTDNSLDSLYLTDAGQKTIRLYNNLDFSKFSSEDQEKYLGINFSGLTIDGQGHTITLPATGNQSLFGTVGADGTTTTIQNLYIKGGTITNAASGTTQGILASTIIGGGAEATTISNCHILSGALSNNQTNYSGSIAGQVTGTNVTIQYCSSIASVTGQANVGGLIGEVASRSTATIKACYANGDVTGTSGGNAGGLVGNLAAGSMTNSFFYSGTVSGGTNNGTLVGSYNSSTITTCYWGITSTSTTKSVGTGTEITEGSFLLDTNNSTSKSGTFGSFNGSTFTASSITVNVTAHNTLLEALIAGTTGVIINGKALEWVYVYGKDYPVIKIE